MRALSGMPSAGVLHDREKLQARPEIDEVLLQQHRANFGAITARDAPAAGCSAEAHMTYTQHVLSESGAAEARLEISIRRIEGGNVTARPRGHGAPRQTQATDRSTYRDARRQN